MKVKSRFAHFILITSLITVSFVPFSVQAYEYPPKVKEKYMRDCLTQPLPPGVNVSYEDRLSYCNCMLNYLQSNLPYEEYKRISNIMRTNIQSLQYESEFLKILEQGLTLCFENIFG